MLSKIIYIFNNIINIFKNIKKNNYIKTSNYINQTYYKLDCNIRKK